LVLLNFHSKKIKQIQTSMPISLPPGMYYLGDEVPEAEIQRQATIEDILDDDRDERMLFAVRFEDTGKYKACLAGAELFWTKDKEDSVVIAAHRKHPKYANLSAVFMMEGTLIMPYRYKIWEILCEPEEGVE
jgi:hypothetical protein